MIEFSERGQGNALGFTMKGKLSDEDYQKLIPVLEAAIASFGKIRLHVQFKDFHGWDLGALWDDFKFGLAHKRDIERIAMVGENRIEEWMAKISKPFTSGEVRYFDSVDVEAAWIWVEA